MHEVFNFECSDGFLFTPAYYGGESMKNLLDLTFLGFVVLAIYLIDQHLRGV